MAALVVGQVPAGGRLGGPDVEHRPQRERVLEIGAPLAQGAHDLLRPVAHGVGLVGDERAPGPAPVRLDVAGLLEHPQRLPQGDPAHAQPHGQLPLGRQPLARGDHAELDGVQDPLDRLLEGVPGTDGTEHDLDRERHLATLGGRPATAPRAGWPTGQRRPPAPEGGTSGRRCAPSHGGRLPAAAGGPHAACGHGGAGAARARSSRCRCRRADLPARRREWQD